MQIIRESLEVKSDYAWFIEKEFGSFDIEESEEETEEVVKDTIEEIRKGLK